MNFQDKEWWLKFPVLNFPRDILTHIVLSKFMDSASTRNFIICCKTIYEKIPSYLKKEYLWRLSRLDDKSPLDVENIDPAQCHRCGEYVKKRVRRHARRCKGILQCYICLEWKFSKLIGYYTRTCRSNNRNLHCVWSHFSKSEFIEMYTKTMVCAYSECKKPRDHPMAFFCAICKIVWFCSRECEWDARDEHDPVCKRK